MPKTIAQNKSFFKAAAYTLLFLAVCLVSKRASAEGLPAKAPANYGTPISAVSVQEDVSKSRTVPAASSAIPAAQLATPSATNATSQPIPSRRRNLLRSNESPGSRSSKAKQIKSPAGQFSSLTGGRPLSNVLGALSIVLGVFFLLAWMMKRWTPKHSSQLPSAVVEVLGRSPLTAKQTMHLVKLGNRLLLVTVTPDGTETLSEITDPDEVTRLVALCGQQKPNAANKTFQKAFEDLTKERTRGFIGQHAPS